MAQELKIPVTDSEQVTARIYPARDSRRAGITLVLGHGAGADQTNRFMVSFAEALADRGLDTVTFNFLYTEQGRRTPDRGDRLETCYLAVISAISSQSQLAGNHLAIGGKSMGGRIASQIAASKGDHLAHLRGLVFLGYPLHPPGKPDQLRAAHLPRIPAPMLFVQGSRDAFGTPDELRSLKLERATLYVIEGGDHSFAVPKKAPVTQAEVYGAVQDEIVRWLRESVDAK